MNTQVPVMLEPLRQAVLARRQAREDYVAHCRYGSSDPMHREHEAELRQRLLRTEQVILDLAELLVGPDIAQRLIPERCRKCADAPA